ncbi:MAG: DUF11 domain-containing protein [Candidatus Brocadiaceae bacterium]|nr:DUF11 domain-containing protein [Candidatus Brocadiaceae bacterium]
MKFKKRSFFFAVLLSSLWGLTGYELQAGAIKHDDPGPHYHGHIHEEPGPRHYEQLHGKKEAPKPVVKSVAPEIKSDMIKTMGAWPTGNKDCCSVIYMEKVAPRTGQVGKDYEYFVKVTNLLGTPVKDVEVIQNLPQNFQIKGVDPEMEAGSDATIAKWFLGDFGPNETKIIKVSGIPTKAGHMPFCTDITYRLPELCLEPEIFQPQLSLTKEAPEEVMLCDAFTVTLVVKNTGTGAARNVVIKDALPAGLKTLDGKSSMSHEIGTLGSGESRKVTVSVKADKTGTFSNAATAVADGDLTTQSNITNTVVRQPALEITKNGPDKRYVGGEITYEIVVANKGDGPAVSTIIEDVIPANTTYVSSTGGGVLSGSKVSWNAGTLKPAESKKVDVTVRASSIGEAKNSVTVRADCAESASATAITKILGIPAVLLEVIDIEDPIPIGENVTYVITVTNQGSEASANVKINCLLEEGMQYVSSSGPTSGTADAKAVTFAPLPSLAPKAKATWKVVIKATAKGDVRFKVTMTDDRLDRPVQETEATYLYE